MRGYPFQNVYMIVTYRCNWSCPFCLFHFNRERECSLDTVLERLNYAIADSKKKVYVKITGGEPFLRPKLLRRIFETIGENRDRVHAVGIGTNGTVRLPKWFKDVQVPTNIFLSRHSIIDRFPKAGDLLGRVENDNIHFRVNCNLIGSGDVRDLASIQEYIRWRVENDPLVESVCFRELSKVNIDEQAMYPPQIYDYMDYYDRNLVRVDSILQEIASEPRFERSRVRGNAYDENYWYWYRLDDGRKFSVKFRKIDEGRLVEFNKGFSGVDEYVIHPDGTLTGCWDKEMKVIKKGGR